MRGFFDDSHVTDVGLQGSTGPSVSLWEMAEQTVRQQYRVDSQRALDEELRTRWYESIYALRAAGQNFDAPVDPLMYRGYARFVREGVPVTVPTTEGEGYGARFNYDVQRPHQEFEEMQRANEAIRRLNNPEIKTFEQILEEVSEMQRGIEEQTASMSERAGPFGILAELAGGIVGSFTERDPLNVVTAPIGAGRTVMTRIGTDMLVAAGVVTATEFGDVQPNRRLAGLPERDPFFNIAVATLGAGVIRGGIEGAGYGLRHLRERFTPEEVDFNLNDSLLRQMFEQRPESPTARAGLQALDDATFIERNNPYGEGQAAQVRFLAELQQVQRAMNGEPMTAIARVLPPVPFEFIQKAADFEIVREQRPLVYARMEQARARLESVRARLENVPRIEEPAALSSEGIDWPGKSLGYPDPRTLNEFEQRANTKSIKEGIPYDDLDRPGTSRRARENAEDPTSAVDDLVVANDLTDRVSRSNLLKERRTVTREYIAAYRAVEAEAARLREKEARIEATEQGKAANIFAVGLEGRSFNLPILKHDYVAELVERINAINDKLDETAVAAFVRQAEGESADVLKNEAGEPLTFYHGTSREFSDENALPGREDRWNFFSTNPEVAGEFAQSSLPSRIYPVRLTAKNVGDFRDPAQVAAVKQLVIERFQKEGREAPKEWLDAVEKGEWGVWEREWITNHFGWDAVWIKEKGELNIAVRSPDQITSALGPWQKPDGRIDIGLQEPVDPEFTFFVDEGEMSVAAAMRDLQDDADLDEAMRTCLI